MELSEAIKAGAKLRPQTTGALFINTSDGIASCAIGAAIEGAGLVDVETVGAGRACFDHGPAEAIWPLLMDAPPKTLPCGCVASRALGPTHPHSIDIAGAITHLNDRHHWRRETIAQWVKSIEEGK